MFQIPVLQKKPCDLSWFKASGQWRPVGLHYDGAETVDSEFRRDLHQIHGRCSHPGATTEKGKQAGKVRAIDKKEQEKKEARLPLK